MKMDELKTGFLCARFSCVVALAVGAMLAGCAQTTPLTTASNPVERVASDPYGEPFKVLEQTASHQARLVIYRDSHVRQPFSVKVYLNERLHAALLPGGFSESCLSPGEFDVRASLDSDNVLSEKDSVSMRRLNMQDGSVLFLMLQESPDGSIFLRSQSAAEAEPGLKNTRRQIHLVSRLKDLQDCEPAGQDQASSLSPGASSSSSQRH